ncbi:MAG: hypothetical protein NW237_09450 [Cyanobacteriota bacterium]|nr:hypothetical protein [Cyanobacteriota bacterium]
MPWIHNQRSCPASRSSRWGIALWGVMLSGLLVATASFAQNYDVNDATARRGKGNTNLFSGTSIELHDLMQAAEALGSRTPPPQQQEKSLDQAIDQFNQSRQPSVTIQPSGGEAGQEDTASP